MPEPAFLVDGVMEQRILGQICPRSPVRRLNCNGLDVALDVIVKKAELHIRLLNNRYHPIVILIDREKRSSNCAQIARDLLSLLEDRGYTNQCIVGVVDRCIENWILADWECIVGHYGFNPLRRSTRTEGSQGKTELKRLLPAGVLYHEPTWGKELFLSCRPEKLYENSPSFRALVDQLDLQCAWLSSLSPRFHPVYE